MQRMVLFHLRQFVAVPYFLQLMLVSTLVATISQRLAVNAWDADPWAAFIRSAVMGLWATVTASGGIIRFEKFKGTLSYFFTSPLGALRPLLALVIAIPTCGMGAFAVAALVWWIPGPGQLTFSVPEISTFFLGMAAAVVMWCAVMGVALLLAAVFVMSAHASAYEALMTTPLLISSGIFGVPRFAGTECLLWLSPTMRVTDFLMHPGTQPHDFVPLLQSGLTAFVWLVVGILAVRHVGQALRRATITNFSL